MELIKRIKVKDNNIYIKPLNIFTKKSGEQEGVLQFSSDVPVINIYEGELLIRKFKIETLQLNPNLDGQFLHYSIRIQENDAVMIDGIISNNQFKCPSWQDANYEAIRLQPFFLQPSGHINASLIGKGLFERGLHYKGTITPGGVRNICICDYCKESFTLQHIHAGLSEVQYFYSAKERQTLLVKYDEIDDLPRQLQEDIIPESLQCVENQLIQKTHINFGYYNPLCCPHCKQPFIDFERYPQMRPFEYYANTFINQPFYYLKDYATS